MDPRPTPRIVEEFVQAQAARGCYAPSTPIRMRRALTTICLDNGEEALIHAPIETLKTTPTRLPRTGAANKQSCVRAFREWYGCRQVAF